MAALMGDVLTTARTYLNDDNALQFPDPVLIPKVQEAHRELQTELWIIGSPLVRGQTAPLAYTTPATTLTAALAGVTDFLCPTALYENAAGSTIVQPGWTPMTEAIYIPFGAAMSATLIWWSWQQEVIQLAGSSANRAVIVQYRRLIPIPTVSTSPIGILFGESYLASRAAAITAGTVGNAEVYAAMTALSKENLAKVISANRGQQKSPMKP
jgi:hypothetical protein